MVKIAAAAATAGLVALLARPITIGDVTVRLRMTAPLVSVQYARHQVVVDRNAAAGGGSLTTLFASDWNDSTGTSKYALLDSGGIYNWDAEKGDANGGVAVTDTVDWEGALPAGTHALTIRHVSGNDNPGVRVLDNSTIPELENGDVRGYRVYLKMLVPSDEIFSGCCHPYQDESGTASNWWWTNGFDVAGEWEPTFAYQAGTCGGCGGSHYTKFTISGEPPTTYPDNYVDNGTYRLEHLMTVHPTADSVHTEMRLYNAADSLLYTMLRIIDDEPSSTQIWYGLDPSVSDQMQLGTNGWSGETVNVGSHVKWHWGGFCITEGDWPGPYGSCDGEGG